MNRAHDPRPSPSPEPAATTVGSFTELQRRNDAALAQLAWQAHLKHCRACRLGAMGGIYGMCERGRRINYAVEFATARARGAVAGTQQKRSSPPSNTRRRSP